MSDDNGILTQDSALELSESLRNYRSAGVRGARLTICTKAADAIQQLCALVVWPDEYEVLAEGYKAISGKSDHASDCATSRAPASKPGPCDCDASRDDSPQIYRGFPDHKACVVRPLHEEVPGDVRRLVIAARRVAFENRGPESLKELDQASEAFAARVAREDEPKAGSAA